MNLPVSTLLAHRLYLGNDSDANDLALLNALRVRFCLSVDGGPSTVACMVLKGREPTLEDVQEAFAEIDARIDAGEAVLIFSEQGLARGAMIAAAYLMHAMALPLDVALGYVSARRMMVDLTLDLMGWLVANEHALVGARSRGGLNVPLEFLTSADQFAVNRVWYKMGRTPPPLPLVRCNAGIFE